MLYNFRVFPGPIQRLNRFFHGFIISIVLIDTAYIYAALQQRVFFYIFIERDRIWWFCKRLHFALNLFLEPVKAQNYLSFVAQHFEIIERILLAAAMLEYAVKQRSEFIDFILSAIDCCF